jgi:integrase
VSEPSQLAPEAQRLFERSNAGPTRSSPGHLGSLDTANACSAAPRKKFGCTYSSILQDNGEDVKVLQELLRHSSSRMTLGVYAQALTPTKRAAQRKVVAMIREDLSVPRECAAGHWGPV